MAERAHAAADGVGVDHEGALDGVEGLVLRGTQHVGVGGDDAGASACRQVGDGLGVAGEAGEEVEIDDDFLVRDAQNLEELVERGQGRGEQVDDPGGRMDGLEELRGGAHGRDDGIGLNEFCGTLRARGGRAWKRGCVRKIWSET